jgi:hypothetical protein
LTQLGEGSEDTRRRVKKADLLGLGGDGEAEKVLKALTDARLVTSGGEGARSDDSQPGREVEQSKEMVEVSHEALIREWPELKKWVDASRDELRMERKILEAVSEWNQAKQDPGLLWTGTRLAQANEWALRHKEEVSSNSPTARFLEASRQQAAEAAGKANRLRRWALGMALAAIAIVVGSVSWIAYDAEARSRKLFEESIVRDPPLMWTRTDNLEDVTWTAAEQYCEDLTLGDYSDWRRPTIEELQRLYDPKDGGKFNIRKPFRLTSSWVWSSTPEGSSSAWGFSFLQGVGGPIPMVDSSYGGRALCVRPSGE